jgi:hypothetical protein
MWVVLLALESRGLRDRSRRIKQHPSKAPDVRTPRDV